MRRPPDRRQRLILALLVLASGCAWHCRPNIDPILDPHRDRPLAERIDGAIGYLSCTTP